MPDVIVTGLPRSGATVVSALIDGLPNAVCLNAPPNHALQAKQLHHPLAFCKWLIGDFAWTRHQLLKGEAARDRRHADGTPALDGTEGDFFSFTRPGLKDDFILGMKQNALFTAILPQLAEIGGFTIIAVIRNPLDVLASWQAMGDKPIAQGKLPAAEKLWPELERIANSETDLHGRMVQLYDAHLQRYHELREHIHILRYEDVVHEPETLSRLLGKKKLSPQASRIALRRRMHNADDAKALRDYFRRYSVYTKQYYPKL